MDNEARSMELLRRIAEAAPGLPWEPDPRGGWTAAGIRVYDDPHRQESAAVRRQRGIAVEFQAVVWRASETACFRGVLQIWDAAFATALSMAEVDLTRALDTCVGTPLVV